MNPVQGESLVTELVSAGPRSFRAGWEILCLEERDVASQRFLRKGIREREQVHKAPRKEQVAAVGWR